MRDTGCFSSAPRPGQALESTARDRGTFLTKQAASPSAPRKKREPPRDLSWLVRPGTSSHAGAAVSGKSPHVCGLIAASAVAQQRSGVSPGLRITTALEMQARQEGTTSPADFIL